MTDIMDLAKRRASTRAAYLSLGASNVNGQTIEEQIEAIARYRLAKDAYVAAEREYRAAIEGLTAEKLIEVGLELSRETTETST